jgi:DNA (cytosine-5)-methyltransferase 1
MKFISLFSGIGGFDLGFERAGMECVAQVEIDPFCQKVLAKHWPHVVRFGDIRNVGKHNLPNAELICGGFPCQPHSTAGKRKGAADDRDLWPQYFRIIDECRPAWVVGENVIGIRTTILDQVLSDLESLDYSTVTLDIPAAGFNAPHIRKRIFIIAHAKESAGRVSVSVGEQKEEHDPGRTGANRHVTDADRWGREITGPSQPEQEPLWSSWWSTEPGICGVAYGVPDRVDRVGSLGNSLMPYVAEWLGRNILQVSV